MLEGYRFIENPDALELVCHHLHDVQFINGLARFVPVIFKSTRRGIIATPPCYISLPNQAVEPAITLTYQRMPQGTLVPVLGQVIRRVLSLH